MTAPLELSVAPSPRSKEDNVLQSKTVHVSKAAPFMQSWNPFVTTGYRTCRTYSEAWASWLYWHNCWLDAATSAFDVIHSTALLMYVHFSGLARLDGAAPLASVDELHFVMLLFYIVSWIHAPPSVAYHLFGCSGISKDCYVLWQRVDFFFIFVSSVPLAYSLSYFALYDYPYLMVASVFGVVCMTLYLASIISEELHPMRRIKIVAGLVFFYTLPIMFEVGRQLSQGHFTAPSLIAAVGIIVSLGFGAFAYGCMFPECHWNDCVVNSHSLMHAGVNCAYFCEFWFIYFTYRDHVLQRDLPVLQ